MKASIVRSGEAGLRGGLPRVRGPSLAGLPSPHQRLVDGGDAGSDRSATTRTVSPASTAAMTRSREFDCRLDISPSAWAIILYQSDPSADRAPAPCRTDTPPPGGGGRDAAADLRGATRSDATHASANDPDARLYRKGDGRKRWLAFIGCVLMDHRHGLAVGAVARRATGAAEHEATLTLLDRRRTGRWRIALGADRAWDVVASNGEPRRRTVTPHVALNGAVGELGRIGHPFLTAGRCATRAIVRAGVTVSGSRRCSEPSTIYGGCPSLPERSRAPSRRWQGRCHVAYAARRPPFSGQPAHHSATLEGICALAVADRPRSRREASAGAIDPLINDARAHQEWSLWRAGTRRDADLLGCAERRGTDARLAERRPRGGLGPRRSPRRWGT